MTITLTREDAVAILTAAVCARVMAVDGVRMTNQWAIYDDPTFTVPDPQPLSMVEYLKLRDQP